MTDPADLDDSADLDDLAAALPWPDYDAATQAHNALGARPDLGRLAGLVEWLAGVQAEFPVRALTRPRLIIVATDHAVATTGVSRLTAADTARASAAIAAGDSVLAELAADTGAGIRVDEVAADSAIGAAVARGVAVADAEIDAGTDLIIAANLGAGSTTTAATIISVLAAVEPVKVTGRGGTRIDDIAWMHKVAAVRDGRRRAWPHRSAPTELLASLDATDSAFLVGVLLRAAARRTPVLLDGLVAVSAAMVADAAKPGARRWWRPAQLTGEPALSVALRTLDLEPVLDLSIAAGDGRGGLLALGLLRAAILLSRTPGPSSTE